MHLAKLTKADLELLVAKLQELSISEYVLVSADGPCLKFSFEDKSHRYATITLFDEAVGSVATLTNTETLLAKKK